MMAGRHLRVRGRVQGVGFRYAFRDQAQRLGVSGWVRNRLDGSVEAAVYGPAEAIETLVEWTQHGPPSARVTDLKVTEHDETYDDFELRPTA